MLLTSVMLYLFDPFAVGFLSLYIMYNSQNVSCYIVVLDRWPARGARDFHVTLPARVYFLRSSWPVRMLEWILANM